MSYGGNFELQSVICYVCKKSISVFKLRLDSIMLEHFLCVECFESKKGKKYEEKVDFQANKIKKLLEVEV